MATDMSNHATELSAMIDQLATHGIKDGENLDKLVGEQVDEKLLFKHQ